MSAVYESRLSDSPYIQIIWRGHAEGNYMPTCPADANWNLLFLKRGSKLQVSVEGPTNKAITKWQDEDSEFLVIKFNLGTFMPNFPVGELLNADAKLPLGADKKFWLDSATWQMPDFDNVEVFVDHLVHEGILVTDPLVPAVLQDQLPDTSIRTVRRRFLKATGLPRGSIEQIGRAQQAQNLLAQGTPILDVVYLAGYADQPHLTRSLRRYVGQTPAQIARMSAVE